MPKKASKIPNHLDHHSTSLCVKECYSFEGQSEKESSFRENGLTEEWLRKEYIAKNRTLESLSNELKINSKMLRQALAYYSLVKPRAMWTKPMTEAGAISLRDPNSAVRRAAKIIAKEAQKAAVKSRNRNTLKRLEDKGITKESLFEVYISQNCSLDYIVNHFGLKSQSGVRKLLAKFDIEKTQKQRDAARLRGMNEFYSDQDRVSEITSRVQTTIRERYGNKWYRVTSSSEETDLADTLAKNFPNLRQSRGDYSIITKGARGGALQLDIYFPEIKLAIEYNGEYYHDRSLYEQDLKDGTELSRERMKDRLCREKGIELIHVWSKTWTKGRDREENRLVELISGRANTLIQ